MGIKMVLTGLVAAMLLLTAAGAQALTNYDQAISPNILLNSSNPSWGDYFLKPKGSFSSATLDLTFSGAIPSKGSGIFRFITYPPNGYVSSDTGLLYENSFIFKNGLNSFTLSGDSLKRLNDAITNNGVGIGLYLTNGSITLNNARLSGTVAPEPVSMALVAAGLVGLPFARRFRNYLR